MPVAAGDFEVTNWHAAEPWDDPGDGEPTLGRATVDKTFTGAIDGTSVAELLTAQGEHGEAYCAVEKFEGIVDGLAGSFVLEHGGHRAAGVEPVSFGFIVRGSGTGELAGITGTANYRHDESGAVLTLSYELS